MLVIHDLNINEINKATVNNNQEYEKCKMLKYENILCEMMYRNKNVSKFIPMVVEVMTSANIPSMKTEKILNISFRKLNQKYMPV